MRYSYVNKISLEFRHLRDENKSLLGRFGALGDPGEQGLPEGNTCGCPQRKEKFGKNFPFFGWSNKSGVNFQPCGWGASQYSKPAKLEERSLF